MVRKEKKQQKRLILSFIAVLMSFFFIHMDTSFGETYLDEEVQKIWWTGVDDSNNRKVLVDFSSGMGDPTISVWTKKSNYTSLRTTRIQEGAVHYVDPMTGRDVKGLNRIYLDGPPGNGTQLGTDLGDRAYDHNQPAVIGKAPHKGADYIYAFRNTYNGAINAELYDLRTSDSYGVGTTTPRLVSSTPFSMQESGASITIMPGADLSYYWVVGVNHWTNPGEIISFKVSADNPSGVTTTPVRSTMAVTSGDIAWEYRNMMPWNSETNGRASIGGTSKLVVSDSNSNGGEVWVFNFDRQSGNATIEAQLSKLPSSAFPSGFVRTLGGSSDFSPSGNYVYFIAREVYAGYIYRWDYQAGKVELVPGQTNAKSGYVQKAPNGRMYVNKGYDQYRPDFGEIMNPDAADIADVGYVEGKYTFPITSTSMDGLAAETIATYVYDMGHAPVSYETTTLTEGNTGITYAKHMYDNEVRLGTKNGYLLGNTRSTTLTDENDDGVIFPQNSDSENQIILGEPTSFQVNISAPGYVSVWLDADQSGTWESGEMIVDRQLITTTGSNQTITVTIPYDKATVSSGTTWLRARYSTYQDDIASPTGWARDGEVEDYLVRIVRQDVTVTKTPATGQYTPGSTVTYTLEIDNPNTIAATNMNVSDLISGIVAENTDGGSEAVFSDWTISAKNKSGADLPSGATVAGTTAGSYANQADLSTTATIAANDKIIYTLIGNVKGNIVGDITNTATVNLDVTTSDGSTVTRSSVSTLTAALPQLEISKTSPTTTYTPNGTVIYTLSVENIGTGAALSIPIKDLVSSIQVDKVDGSTGDAYSGWTISAIGVGTGTTTGAYADNTDLDTTVDIAAGGSVTYTITGTVAQDAIGIINNQGTINGIDTAVVSHTSESATVSAVKTSTTTEYAPGNSIIYTLTIINSGNGFAQSIPVVDAIGSITVDVIDGGTSAAFANWTISAATVGTGTSSGTFSDDANLNTAVNIAPGGSVTYTITGTVTENAVGTISNQATVNDVDTEIVNHVSEGANVSGVKSSTTTEYAPGGQIIYTLTLTNTGSGFAQNIPVEDIFSTITTDLVGGGTGPSFTGWTISATTVGNGTNAGSYHTDIDLDTLVTIAPQGSITYTITAEVATDAVGTITNIAAVNGVNTASVSHTSERSSVSAVKNSTTTEYTPSGQIAYTLTVTNDGNGYAQNISVADALSTITTDIVGGGNGTAFSSWTINATTTGTGTTAGTYGNNSDLNATINIAPQGSVTYTITGTVSENAVGTISNEASIEGVYTNIVSHTSESADVSATKTSGTMEYTPGGQIVYTLTVNNTGSGYAQDVSVKDAVSTITTDLIGGTTGAAFTDWTISAVSIGTGTTTGSFSNNTDLDTTITIAPNGSVTYTLTGTVAADAVGAISNKGNVNSVDTGVVTHISESASISGTKTSNTTQYAPGGQIIYTLTVNNTGNGYAQNIPVKDALSGITVATIDGTEAAFADWTISASSVGTGTTTGSFSSNTDLDTTINIAPQGSVTYTIAGTVSANAVGTISNQAIINQVNTSVVNHVSEGPAINGVKNSATAQYAPGGQIVYTLTVNNNGTGYAQDIPVQDALSGITTDFVDGSIGSAFSSWTISAIATGNGSSTGIYNNNADLDTLVNIAPGGSVTYTIIGTVSANAVGAISNQGTINNVATSIVNHTSESADVSAVKTSATTKYSPGGQIIYTLTVNNTGNGYAQNISVKDAISSITTDLIGGTNGAAFTGWTISATSVGTGTTTGSFSNDSDLDTAVNIAPQGNVTYTITGTVAENAIGTISNQGIVEGSPTSTVNHTSESADVSAVKTSATTEYSPGGQIIYTLTVNNTGNGYAQNIPVKDAISSITTDLIGGTNGAAFSNWTINATTTGTGSDAGVYSDNTDLDTTIQIAPSGSVTYTITGTVAENAVGSIENKGTVNNTDTSVVTHTSEGASISAVKTSGTTQYAPGGQISYTITVTNSGSGYGQDISLKDAISTITTDLIGGTNGAAFSSWTISATTSGTGTDAGTYSNNTDLDTLIQIAPSGIVTYTITGAVAENAVGTISNKATVNSTDTSTVDHTSESATVSAVKASSTSQYAPSGQIVYTLTVENSGNGYAQIIPVKDELSSITTDVIDGGTGVAFSSWTISAATAGNGTDAGTYGNNSDLDTMVTIAPNGSVTYTITGTVAANATGTIRNQAVVNDVTTNEVSHTSEPGRVEASKASSETTYAPGGNIVYTIRIQNTGSGYVNDISVLDTLSGITTELSDGTVGGAFQSWTISAETAGEGTQAGTFSDNSDLNSLVRIAPGGEVIYTITGKVSDSAIGRIINRATVDSVDTNFVEHTSRPGSVSATKSSGTTTYSPAENIVYTIQIENTGDGIVSDVPVQDLLSSIQVIAADGSSQPAFSNWTITAATAGTGTDAGTYSNSSDLDTRVKIAPHGSITYTITATVASTAAGTISNQAEVNEVMTGTVVHQPTAAIIQSEFTSDTNTYTSGGEILYTLTIRNVGSGFASQISVSDYLSQLMTNQITGGTGRALSGWTISSSTTGAGSNAGSYFNQQDLDTLITIAPGGSVTYLIRATVSATASGPIQNISTVNGASTATVAHTPESTGDLVLTKSTISSQVEAGTAAGYEIHVLNNTNSVQNNVVIYDRHPSGFSYIEKSGSYSKNEESSIDSHAVVNDTGIVFGPFTLEPGEDLKLTYALKVSSLVSPGTYDNIAIARSATSGEALSNEDRASVVIYADTFVNAATIIGKVYEDIDGDGYQDPAKATKIKIEDWQIENALPGTAVVQYYNSQGDKKGELAISDVEIQQGAFQVADKLEGQFLSGAVEETDRLVFQVELSKPEIKDSLKIHTAEGMIMEVAKDKLDTSKSGGDYRRGLTSQAFKVVREMKEKEGRYFFELTIINIGIQEEGIPGVKLITPEGLTIYTDQFGRYHVPTRIIENGLKSNFVIKVDEQSLPYGMRVISENPKAKMITSYGLNEFDFGVQTKEKQENQK